jgi:signal transduction histidine kinase
MRFGIRLRRHALGYAVAVLATAICLAVRWLLGPVLGAAMPYLTFFPAVALAAYVGGFWSGLLATLLSVLGANYFSPAEIGLLNVTNVARGLLFVLVSIIVSGLSESLHRARRRALDQQRQLTDAQTELARVNRITTVGQLASSIAHEVKNPISALITQARAASRWLAAEPPDLNEVRQALSAIVRDANRASDVVARISGLVKRVAPRREPLDLNEIILEVAALTRTETRQNDVSLKTQLATDLPLVQADRVQLQQVLLNLVLNAIEAMSEVSDRELLIKTAPDSQKDVIVEVRDTGPGLEPDQLEHVFDAFYTTKVGGVGVGLAICRSIVEAHGGRISASAGVPRGAVFRFTVPARSDVGSAAVIQ